MNIIEKLKQNRLANLQSFDHADDTYYVREPQAEDIADAMRIARNAAKLAGKSVNKDLMNLPPDESIKVFYTQGIEADTLEYFGLNNPKNAFEQEVGMASLFRFMSYQFASVLMDKNGNKIYTNDSERNELAEYIREDKEFRDKIAVCIANYSVEPGNVPAT